MKRNTLMYKTKQFLMFAGPAGFLFFGTVIVPFVYGLYLTFTSWDGISRVKISLLFVGGVVCYDARIGVYRGKRFYEALGLDPDLFVTTDRKSVV